MEHFHHKKLAEDHMKSQGVPFIALRPGAFLDQATDHLGDGIKRGDSFALSVWNKTVPSGWTHSPDLAQLFCAAIELPDDADGKSIDVGWSRPIAMQEVVSIAATKLDRNMSCHTVPFWLRVAVLHWGTMSVASGCPGNNSLI